MKKALPLILLAVVAVALFFIKRCGHASSSSNNKSSGSTSTEVNRDRGFDRRVSYLQYSNHARCRMECRHITQAEVEEIRSEERRVGKSVDIGGRRSIKKKKGAEVGVSL